MDNQEKQGKGSPYVGTVDIDQFYLSELDRSLSARGENNPTSLTSPPFPGYRIPPKGQIQLVVKNANQTAVKLFLVPYDLSDMPPGSKTFLRQKSYDLGNEPIPLAHGSESPSPSPRLKEALRYAIHLQFCASPTKERERGRKRSVTTRREGTSSQQRPSSGSPRPKLKQGSQQDRYDDPKNQTLHQTRKSGAEKKSRSNTANASHIYLHKNIRIVFTSRALDLSEKLKVVIEGPSGLHQQSPSSSNPTSGIKVLSPMSDKYTSYAGPGEIWQKSLAKRSELEKAFESGIQLEDPVPWDPNGASMFSGSPVLTSVPSGLDAHMPLLNTPPSTSSFDFISKESDTAPLHASKHGESIFSPKTLSFQRSPTPNIVPLPALIESGLSISRPGSRTEIRKPTSNSPERRAFGTLPSEGCLR